MKEQRDLFELRDKHLAAHVERIEQQIDRSFWPTSPIVEAVRRLSRGRPTPDEPAEAA